MAPVEQHHGSCHFLRAATSVMVGGSSLFCVLCRTLSRLVALHIYQETDQFSIPGPGYFLNQYLEYGDAEGIQVMCIHVRKIDVQYGTMKQEAWGWQH